MNNILWGQAKTLAARPYTRRLEEDSLSNHQVVYIASYVELPGCKAQGFTKEEAITNLGEASIDYIYALLESGLEVPPPAKKELTNSQTFMFDASGNRLDQEDDLLSLEGDLIKHT